MQVLVTAIAYAIAILLALKIVHNLMIPYRLFWIAEDRDDGVGLGAWLDLALLLLLNSFVAISRTTIAGAGWKHIALISILAVIGSYIHLFVVGNVLGTILRRRHEKQGK